ncbi:hypothetical protein ACFVH6_25750 [Spirillospora sp. NPDC127200]
MSEQQSSEVEAAKVETPEPSPALTPEQLQARIAELTESEAKWKAMARKHEDRAKTTYTELEALKQSGMSEAERAIAEAEARGRQAALAEAEAEKIQLRLAAEAAKAGVPDEVLSYMDPTKFVNANGEINREALAALAKPAAPRFEKSAAQLGVGPQSSSVAAGQLTQADLRRMSPAEVMKARSEGKLDALMLGQI